MASMTEYHRLPITSAHPFFPVQLVRLLLEILQAPDVMNLERTLLRCAILTLIGRQPLQDLHVFTVEHLGRRLFVRTADAGAVFNFKHTQHFLLTLHFVAKVVIVADLH